VESIHPTTYPPQGNPARLSAAGKLLTGVLIAMAVYALARCVDQLDRLHFIDQIRNGAFAHQVALGQTTLAAISAKAKALDHRNGFFVAVSWVASFASFGAYRNWRLQQPAAAASAQIRLLERAAAAMWIIALGAQIFRATSPIAGDLSAAHSDAMVNLFSRAIIIPAVLASIAAIRLREGLSLRLNAPAPAPVPPAAATPVNVYPPVYPPVAPVASFDLPPGPPTLPN